MASSEEWADTKIPARLLKPHIGNFLRSRQMSFDTLRQHLGLNGTFQGLDPSRDDGGLVIGFDLADKVICFVSHPLVWHEDPALEEAYQKVDLAFLDKQTGFRIVHGRGATALKCKRAGCKKTFEREGNDPKTGRTAKKFCSESCKKRAYRQRHGLKKAAGSEGGVYNQDDPMKRQIPFVCRSGKHARTPENTRIRSDGTRLCRDCNRASETARARRLSA